jgi:Zn-dependent protease/CBS domain-containing protein
MRTFYAITRVRGIPIRMHYTWIIAALIGGWIVSARVLAESLPRLSGLGHLLLVIAILALGLGSIAWHELAHYAVARRFGLRPRTITLYPFGGVPSQLDQRAGTTNAIWVALAGPAASLALSALLGVLSAVDGVPQQMGVVLGITAQMNLALTLINLLPGLPLDGGRVVRAIAWQWTLGYGPATALARNVGQAIAYGLIFVGAWLFVAQEAMMAALLLVLLGWMLRESGSVNQQRTLLDEMLGKLTAADLTQTVTTAVTPDATLRQVHTETLHGRSGREPIPVVMDDRFVGMLTMPALFDVPQGTWNERTVADIMLPAADIAYVTADAPLSTIIPQYAELQEHDTPVLPVVADGRLVGLVDTVRMDAVLELEDALALYGRQPQESRYASVARPTPAGPDARST